MGRWWSGRILLLAFAFTTWIFSSSCTREVPESLSISLSVPPVLGSLSTQPMRLGLIVVNLRPAAGAGAPVLLKFNGDQFGNVGPGGFVQIPIPGFQVPRDPQLMVQYFGVFEAEDAGMQFSYGSTIVNSDTNGAIPANITATVFGNASRRANVMGRYDFNPTTGTDFRNGRILMEFIQTGGDPFVEIEKSDMVNGWFSTVAVDSAGAIRHTFFNDDGSPGVQIFGGDTSVTAISSLTTGTNAAKINMPIRTKKEIQGFESTLFQPRLEPPQDIFVGMFTDDTGYCTEYPGTDMFIHGLYTPDLLTPLKYLGSGGTPGVDPMVETGGQTGLCGGTLNDTDIKINPRWLAREGLPPHGVQAPFVALGDYDEEPLFARARVVDNSTNPRIKLRWKYLPGLSSAHVMGAEIFIKHAPDGGGGGGGGDKDIPCGDALQFQGYNYHSEVGPGIETLDVDLNAQGNNFSYDYMSPDYFRNFKFAVCPFRDVAGARTYYGSFAEVFDVADPREVNPLSFGEGTDGTQVLSTATGYVGWGERITNVSNVGDDITRITLATTGAGPAVGDEVFISVMGGGGTGQCGYQYGQTGFSGIYEILPGDFHMARVHGEGLSGNRYIEIRSGSWVDDLNTANLTGPGTGTFCYVQAQEVRHYESATFNSTGNLNLGSRPFDFASNAAGGIMTLRIADMLTLDGTPTGGSWFNADFAGYRSGGAGENGHGFGGSSTGTPNLSGGTASAGNGGGGGAGLSDGGDGANNGGSAGMGSFPPGGQQPVFTLGSGGGADDGGPSGHGGGMIMLNARAIHMMGSGPIATANGQTGSVGTGGGGGGGGGSVNIVTERLTRTATQNLDIYVNGGAGGSGSFGGGGGGGGAIRVWGCPFWNADPAAPAVVPVFQGNGGVGGTGGTAGQNGVTTSPGDLSVFYGPGCVPDP